MYFTITTWSIDSLSDIFSFGYGNIEVLTAFVDHLHLRNSFLECIRDYIQNKLSKNFIYTKRAQLIKPIAVRI